MTVTATARLITAPMTATIAMHNIAHGGMQYTFSVANGGLSAAQINGLFADLKPVTDGQTVNITGNPGVSTCNPSIATSKGWTVIGDFVPPKPE